MHELHAKRSRRFHRRGDMHSTNTPRKALILGDSHTCYMKNGVKRYLYAPREVEVCKVQGSTAAGLTKPNSFTNALNIFRCVLQNNERNCIVALHLGEVDCGILVWLQAEKYNISIQESIHNSVQSYFNFVDEIISEGFSSIVVTGATLPTINDSDQLGAVVNARRSKVRATQVERTQATFEFNNLLRNNASNRSLLFVDVKDDVLDRDTGLVSSTFRNRNPADHHMDANLAAVPWAARLNSAFNSIDPLDSKPSEKKTWKARRASYVKALDVESSSLPNEFKFAVAQGDVLTANFLGEVGAPLSISGVTLNGRPLVEAPQFIFRPHWESLASDGSGDGRACSI